MKYFPIGSMPPLEEGEGGDFHHQGMLIARCPLTLTIHPYHPLLLASPLDGIKCLHRVD